MTRDSSISIFTAEKTSDFVVQEMLLENDYQWFCKANKWANAQQQTISKPENQYHWITCESAETTDDTYIICCEDKLCTYTSSHKVKFTITG